MSDTLPKGFLTALTFEQSTVAYIQVIATQNGDIYCHVYSEQTGYQIISPIYLFNDNFSANKLMSLTDAINRYTDTH
jgi:hypothetical protein